MYKFLGKYKRERSVLTKQKIGEGSYGCLFFPPFPCEDHDEKDYEGLVSKVLTSREAKKEFEISKLLKSIDILTSGRHGTLSARYKYGVYALDNCKFPLKDHREIDAFNSVSKPCSGRLFENRKYHEPYDSIIHMEKADGDMHVAFYEKNLLRYLPKLNINVWISGLENILKGLENMHKHNVYHFDVKTGNTLFFGSIKGPLTCKLIDFGLSSQIKSPSYKALIDDLKKEDIPLQFRDPWVYHLPCAPLIVLKNTIFEKYGEKELLKEETINDLKYRMKVLYEYYDKYLVKGKYYNFVHYLEKDFLERSFQTSYFLYKGNVHDLATSCDLYNFVLMLDKFYEIPLESENKKKSRSILNFLFDRAINANLNHQKIYKGLHLLKKIYIQDKTPVTLEPKPSPKTSAHKLPLPPIISRVPILLEEGL